jgi:RNA polymerase sigma-70 factor (ECF subfamily)
MGPVELEQQLEELHPGSFAWALRCCSGNHGEAEDVLQTTYLKILEGRARYRGASSLKTWLFGVIRKTAAGRFRSEALRAGLMQRFRGAVPVPATVPDPSGHIELLQEKERLERAVATLSPRQRQLIDLVFYHELSIREAAKVLGISVGSARTHYERAKSQLFRMLDERWPS